MNRVMPRQVTFNQSPITKDDWELAYSAVEEGATSGDGKFTKIAEKILDELHPGRASLLTTSGSHALEMSARLLDLQPGDEVLVPAYSFVTTASSFCWNGAKPVFCDVDSRTLNISPESVELNISPRTRAICVVNYAGIGVDYEQIKSICSKHGLVLIEDNAHGLGAKYQGQTLGTFGDIAITSFHETKNISCGEGGAIFIRDSALAERARILREKGTNRSAFISGLVDKYTWVDIGSSWVLADILAGVLVSQLWRMQEVNSHRRALWSSYHNALASWAMNLNIQQPHVPDAADHVGHLYFLRFGTRQRRDKFIQFMANRGIQVVFHYQALNTSPTGKSFMGQSRSLPNSELAAQDLVRLPIHSKLDFGVQQIVIDAILQFSE